MKDWKKNKSLKRVIAFLLVSSMLWTSLIEPNRIAASMGDPSMTFLTYEDDNLVVTATTDVNEAFAEGDTLKVTPITAEDAETVAQYDIINSALQAKASEENYNLAGFQAYDISLVDENGEEITLNNDVNISMNFKTPIRPYNVDIASFGTNGYKITALELNDGQAVDLTDDSRLCEWSVDTDFQLQQTTFTSHQCREYAFAWMEEKVTEPPEVTEIPEATETPKAAGILAVTETSPLIFQENFSVKGQATPIEESILTEDMLKYNNSDTSNKWQVVDQEYIGNGSENKTVYGPDGNVRVQKNVIATDVENEFLVYLSIDTKEMFEEYFEKAEFYCVTSDKAHAQNVGDIIDYEPPGSPYAVGHTETSNYVTFLLVLNINGEEIAKNFTVYYQGQAPNNSTWYLKLSDGGYLCLGVEVRKNEINESVMDAAATEVIIKDIMKAATLQNVEDTLGDYIEFISIEDGNYEITPEVTVNDEGNTVIHWIPKAKTSVEQMVEKDDTVTTVWNQNVAELVYRVRLNVEKSGFHSCADNMNSIVGDLESYEVNHSAVLTYNDGQTVTFPKPYVRGLLYEFKFKKVDSEDASTALEGADFALTFDDKTYEAAYLGNGEYGFSDIPWGTYTLTEMTAPAGYKIGDVSSWRVDIGYTLDLQDGTVQIDRHIHEDNSSYYKWTGYYDTDGALKYDANAVWKIINKKIKSSVIFKKVSAEDSDAALPGAEFELYDSNRNLIGKKMISGSDGIFALEDMQLPNGTYYLKETKAPTGYVLLSGEIEITVSDTGVTENSDEASVDQSTNADGLTIYTITVKNEVLYSLPSTGGRGILWYVMSGMLFMVAAVFILYKKQMQGGMTNAK